MFRLAVVACSVLVLTALLADTGHSGDKKDPPRKQVQLPQGWKKLGLSDDQKKKIYATRTMYSAKIESLRQQIDQAKKDEMIEMVKVLSEPQKETLRKAAADKVPSLEKKTTEEKKPAPDK